MSRDSRLPPAPPRPSAEPSAATCNALVDLSITDHYVIRVDRRCRLLFARRTPTPFSAITDIRECFDRVENSLASVPRNSFNLLVDARYGPSRNDRGFELILEQQRGKLLFGFARSAALAATAAGRLQIQRYAKHDRREVFVTDDPELAFEYLGLPQHPL